MSLKKKMTSFPMKVSLPNNGVHMYICKSEDIYKKAESMYTIAESPDSYIYK